MKNEAREILLTIFDAIMCLSIKSFVYSRNYRRCGAAVRVARSRVSYVSNANKDWTRKIVENFASQIRAVVLLKAFRLNCFNAKRSRVFVWHAFSKPQKLRAYQNDAFPFDDILIAILPFFPILSLLLAIRPSLINVYLVNANRVPTVI